MGAFTRRLADDIAALRPLVVAKTFNPSKTGRASREVSVTLTTYAAVEQSLAGCSGTSKLVERVKALRATAESALARSQSTGLTNAKVQRSVAVTLFGLLSEVLDLSREGATLAGTLGVPSDLAQVPDGQAEPVGSLAPLPTPSPKPTPIAPPKPETVALPKLSIKVSGATAIKYFPISGDAPVDLANAMERGARRNCGKEALACVHLVPGGDLQTYVDPYTGSCTILSASIPLKSTVYLPRWTKPARVAPSLLSWWRKVLAHIAWHEGQHIKIEKSYLAKMKADLAGEPCSRGQSVINRWSTKANAAQAAFDAKDRSWRYPIYTGPGGFYGY